MLGGWLLRMNRELDHFVLSAAATGALGAPGALVRADAPAALEPSDGASSEPLHARKS